MANDLCTPTNPLARKPYQPAAKEYTENKRDHHAAKLLHPDCIPTNADYLPRMEALELVVAGTCAAGVVYIGYRRGLNRIVKRDKSVPPPPPKIFGDSDEVHD